MSAIIITAAICGAEVTKDDNPALPISAAELAEEAYQAEQAGAAIIHLHVRDAQGKPTQSRQIYSEAITAIRERGVEAIIQPSTGGAAWMDFSERFQPLELNPEMATLDCGTCNFGNEIFRNDLPMMRQFADAMNERSITPELECFEPGHINNALILHKEGRLPRHLHFDFVLGVPGALHYSCKNLLLMSETIPTDATWTVAATGRWQLPAITQGILLGGHIRVGFEDNIFYRRGELARNNGQLVERAARLARELGREVATPQQARNILKLGQGTVGLSRDRL